MTLNLILIGENPDKFKCDDIDNFDEMVQDAHIWNNDSHRWWYYYKAFVTCITKTIIKNGRKDFIVVFI